MKLLFYISSMQGGGAERVMSVLCNELADKQYEIYLATNTKIPIAYELNDEVKVISLYPDNYDGMIRVLRFCALLSSIRKIATHTKPDIIISFMAGMTAKVIPAIWGLSIPIVASEHTTYDRVLPFITKFQMLYIDRFADRVTVLSQHDYDYLGKRLPKKVVMPNPLSLPILKETPDRRKNILAVGRLDGWWVKGFDNLIKVWSKLAILYPDWCLEIAGTGSSNNLVYLQNLVESYSLQGRVRFLGFQSAIAELMQQSSIFVLSSRNEGFGMVLLEAMSQGCACISFDCVAGPNEIITQNVSGVLVENQNLEKLEYSLSKVIKDEELRKFLSYNAIKEAESFLPEKIVHKWENMFLELIK